MDKPSPEALAILANLEKEHQLNLEKINLDFKQKELEIKKEKRLATRALQRPNTSLKFNILVGIFGLTLSLLIEAQEVYINTGLADKNYFLNILIYRIISVMRFLVAAYFIGYFFFYWKKGVGQFWYGVTEVVAALTYCYFNLDKTGSMPMYQWAPVFYFMARGVQNVNEGIIKKFFWKQKILRSILRINIGTSIVWNALPLSKKRR